MKHWTRRQFLGAALVTLLVAACERQSGRSNEGASEEAVIDAIETGQGAIVTLGGQQVAVYKAEDGSVIRLSPVCPHAGCQVDWNTGEGTWDCPCHASRFEADGTLRSGPAREGLSPLS